MGVPPILLRFTNVDDLRTLGQALLAVAGSLTPDMREDV